MEASGSNNESIELNKSNNHRNLKNCELPLIVCDKIGHLIGSTWQSFARHLGLSDQDIEHINHDKSLIHDKAVSVLSKWKQSTENPSWEKMKEKLTFFQRLDVIEKVEHDFADLLFTKEESNSRRIPHGVIFIFDLNDGEICTEVEFQLIHENNNWISISNKKNKSAYYSVKQKNNNLCVKVENLFYKDENISFRFLFQDLKRNLRKDSVNAFVAENCDYQLTFNGITIATPEPVFNNNFSKDIRTSSNLDWREKTNIDVAKIPSDKPLEVFALEYVERNFSDCNDVIFVPPVISDNDLNLVFSKFVSLLADNDFDICAVISNYCLRYHASFFNCNTKSFRNCKDENRIMIFYSNLNLVLIVRIATSLDSIASECENCLNDIRLFVNVYKPLIESKGLIILGTVVVPLFDSEIVNEQLFFHFSDSFALKQILFLCKDGLEDENFGCWWRSVAAYCRKNVYAKFSNQLLFQQLIGLTIITMEKVDHCLPSLETNSQKQIKSLILNYEQWVAIHDKQQKKIVSGGYGSGKSIVGKEIVKYYITKMSENPFTLYYICCNHFSLFECEMKEFVDSIDKTSNCTVVCDNLYELWKAMLKNKGIKEEYISISKLLEYLVVTNTNNVGFVLEELSAEYVKEDDAIELNKLFLSALKDSLVVFIPESVEKNRVLIRNDEKHLIQKNCFNEEALHMKVFTLNKSMRVTRCNKLLIDSSQDSVCKSKTVCNFPNSNVDNITQINKENLNAKIDSRDDLLNETKDYYNNKTNKSRELNVNHIENTEDVKTYVAAAMNFNAKDLNDMDEAKSNNTPVNDFHNNHLNYLEIEEHVDHLKSKNLNTKINENEADFYDYDFDHMSKTIANNKIKVDPNSFLETGYVFKSGEIGHSIEGEKPMVVYFPFQVITKKQSVKHLSFVLENLCFSAVRKTVILCNNMEEVKSVAYAIDIIGSYKAVTYSPHLQKYSPTYKEKFKITKKLVSEFDILVTDIKGFSGAESESVIVLVNPEEIHLRHVLVDAMARSNSHLIVLVLGYNDMESAMKDDLINEEDNTIKRLMNNWCESYVEKIVVKVCNDESQLIRYTDCSLIINEGCEKFNNRGTKKDFEKYINDPVFQINHENNLIYETMALDLAKKYEKEPGKDVVGIVKSSSEMQQITTKATNKQAEKFEEYTDKNPVVAIKGDKSIQKKNSKKKIKKKKSKKKNQPIKGAKVSDFGGWLLSILSSSYFHVNPDITDIPEAFELRRWFNNGGVDKQATSISGQRMEGAGGGKYITLGQIKDEGLGMGEKPDYFNVRAFVVFYRKENCMYQACPGAECNKKVIEDNGQFRCEKCDRTYPDFKYRMVLSSNIADFSGNQWITAFQESAEAILGVSAEQIGHLKDSDVSQFDMIFSEACFKPFVFKVRAKMETYQDERKLKCSAVSAAPVNFKQECKRLLDEIKILERL